LLTPGTDRQQSPQRCGLLLFGEKKAPTLLSGLRLLALGGGKASRLYHFNYG
jgi:hypothetical protein